MSNYGWICPKCGCPNSPANSTCAACFNIPGITELPNPVGNACPKCGLNLEGTMGYVCNRLDCPTGLGPVVCSSGG